MATSKAGSWWSKEENLCVQTNYICPIHTHAPDRNLCMPIFFPHWLCRDIFGNYVCLCTEPLKVYKFPAGISQFIASLFLWFLIWFKKKMNWLVKMLNHQKDCAKSSQGPWGHTPLCQNRRNDTGALMSWLIWSQWWIGQYFSALDNYKMQIFMRMTCDLKYM